MLGCRHDGVCAWAGPGHTCAACRVLCCAQGFAYVEFATDEGVQQAEALRNPEVNGRRLTILRSAPPGAGGGRHVPRAACACPAAGPRQQAPPPGVP
jgi:hypothetical protein